MAEIRKYRLDEWCVAYDAPTDKPHTLALVGGVFRGFNNLDKAKAYADQVTEWWTGLGLKQAAYVVQGPTSTTKCKYEVVDATAGYTKLHSRLTGKQLPN